MAEEVARRLDAMQGTRGAFLELCRHAARCVTEIGGLNGSGIFFVVQDGVVRSRVYRVGMDEPTLERYLVVARETEGFKGHGTIVGALIDELDSVMLQFCTTHSGHVSVRWDVATRKDYVDDSNFSWE